MHTLDDDRHRARKSTFLAVVNRQTAQALADGLGASWDDAAAAWEPGRPATVVVCWFVAYAGHAPHRWPEHRQRLRDGDRDFAVAFAHELRRFYPFAPFIGGRAVRDLVWRGNRIPQHAMVLLDLWGHNHYAELWATRRPTTAAPASH